MKKKISIILPSLENGGAERLHIYLANSWVELGFDVTVVILHNKTNLKKFLNNKINLKILNAKKIKYSLIPLTTFFLINKPDIIVTAMWPLTSITILSKLISFKKSKLITVDHCPYANLYSYHLKINKSLLFKIINFTYKFAFKNIVVSQTIKTEFEKFTKLNSKKIIVINNGIKFNAIDLKKSSSLRQKLFDISKDTLCAVSIGNLKPQKNFINLLKAFKVVIRKLKINLYIIGDGEEKKNLQNYILSNNLNNNVFLLGYKDNVIPYLSNADLFINSSDYDGFPLVLIEALISKIKIVSTDCESGPSEILKNGKYGLLVPIKDHQALASAIIQSFENVKFNSDYEEILNNYSIEGVSLKYIKVFDLDENK